MANKGLSYVLITPAHNEEAFLDRTIESVTKQSEKPLRWIIVDDASTDRTRLIAEQAAAEADFIQVVSVARSGDRSFNNKVRAFERGLQELNGVEYDLIGNLDADISFGPDYFANLLREFRSEPRLGITGGSVHTQVNGKFVATDTTIDTVGGAVQLFRRDCFEKIGGYTCLPYGGIDSAAEIMAREAGWIVRKSLQDKVLEHRRTGSANANPLKACFRLGRRFHSLGYGVTFFVIRCLYRMTEPPVIVGSFASLLGYFESAIKQRPPALSPRVVRYLRAEQRSKLLGILRSRPDTTLSTSKSCLP